MYIVHIQNLACKMQFWLRSHTTEAKCEIWDWSPHVWKYFSCIKHNERPPDVSASRCVRVVVCHSWSVGDWGVCSHSCGTGEQIRQVQCLQKTGLDGIETVTGDQCVQPPPYRKQTCNVHTCPPVWTSGPWSQVSLLHNLSDLHKAAEGHKLKMCGQMAKVKDRMCSVLQSPHSFISISIPSVPVSVGRVSWRGRWRVWAVTRVLNLIYCRTLHAALCPDPTASRPAWSNDATNSAKLSGSSLPGNR